MFKFKIYRIDHVLVPNVLKMINKKWKDVEKYSFVINTSAKWWGINTAEM